MKPSTGNIFIDGIDIFRRKEFRKEMGIVFQNPDAQIPFPKVFDDIEFALNNLKIENKNEILLSDRIMILENKEIKHTIEKNKLLEDIQILQKCDIRIPDIIEVILRLKEKRTDELEKTLIVKGYLE